MDWSDSQIPQHGSDPFGSLGDLDINPFDGLDPSLSTLLDLNLFSVEPAIDAGFGHSNFPPTFDQCALPVFDTTFLASPTSSGTSYHSSPSPEQPTIHNHQEVARKMLLPPLPISHGPLLYVHLRSTWISRTNCPGVTNVLLQEYHAPYEDVAAQHSPPKKTWTDTRGPFTDSALFGSATVVKTLLAKTT